MELVFFYIPKIVYECIKFCNNLIFNVQKQKIIFYFFLIQYLILIILITKNTHFIAAIKTRRTSISAMTA